jgi:hypothetical protein
MSLLIGEGGSINQGILCGYSKREIALARPQGTPLRLQGDRPNTPLSDPICVVVQPRQGSLAIPSGSTPEHFRRSSSTRPDDRVDIVWGRLLSPEELLTAEHQITL